MRRSWIAVVLAATLMTPVGAVLAQNAPENTSDTDGDDVGDANVSLADLQVDDLEVNPEDPRPGDNVTFDVAIENDGEGNASAFNVSATLDGEQVFEQRVPGLVAGEEISLATDPVNVSEGEHQVNVTVDVDEEVEETDEENNEDSESFEVEAREEPEEAEEADEEDETDEKPDRQAGPESSWSNDNGTYIGEHARFVLDEELPGITNYELLPNRTSVFDSVALPAGGNVSHHAVRDIFAMEAGEDDELTVRDVSEAWLTAEAENATVTIDVADGVNVSEYDPSAADDDDEDEADDDQVYQLGLANNQTLYLLGEDLNFANDTFAGEEVHLTDEFPPRQDDRDEREDHDERMEDRREQMEDRRERMEERREAGSQWDRDGDSFTGEYAKFGVNENASAVEDYALIGSTIPVFDEVALADNASDWEAHGKQFELKTDDGRIKVLDVPPAVLLVRAGENASQMTLADGVEIEELDRDDDDDGAAYRLSLAENRTGWLVGEEITLDNGTLTVEDRAIFRTAPSHADASENRGPGSMPDEARSEDRDEDRDDDERGPPEHAKVHELDNRASLAVEEAAATGKIGVEVHMGANGSQPVAVQMNENIQVKKAWAGDDGPTRAGLTIEAPDDTPGTTVTLNLNESQLGNVSIDDAGEKLEVEFDNETIPIADDLDDVLNPNDDNGTAEYLLLVGGDKVQVLVSVPHFSPHTIEVNEASTQSSGEETANGAPGFTAAALVAATGLTALAARTQRK